ncbi:MAG: L-threonine 3-dehydrogenase [Coxiella sp. (in: Bacteria)]|nr:MAG: L-threonine 3-dehydrogenase [Coxiella sp. (in: g-proteobacteria)]
MNVLKKLKAEPGLWLSDDAIPEPGYNDVRIKIHKTAICGTDLHIYNWDAWSQKTVPVPLTIGHEFIGEVDAVGPGVENFKPGERVSGEGHIVCGKCRNCRAGKRHLCRHTRGIGCQIAGAFAEYLVIPAANTYAIPDDITDNQAALLDPFGNAVHTTLAFDLVGEDVLITGAGPIGLMSAAIAKHIGARHVVVTDVIPYRLELAKKMGATVAVNTQETNLKDVIKQLGMKEGFDVGFEMSGHPQAFTEMLDVMNHGGNIAFLGVPKDNFPIDWHQVIFKSLTIKGIYGRRMFETWYKGISMLQSGLDITPVITGEYPYRDFEKGFQEMLSGKAGKIILDWRGNS